MSQTPRRPSAITTYALLGAVALSGVVGCGGWSQNDVRALGIRRVDDPEEDEERPPAAATQKEEPNSQPAALPVASATAPAGPSQVAATDDQAISDTVPPPTAPLSAVERASRSEANLERIAEAMVAYRDAKGVYPPAAVYDASGAPLLSWRVALLPYLGHERLYSFFDLKQPWYAPANKRLLKYIPAVFQAPERFDEKTCYRLPIGSGTLFPERKSLLPQRVEDGLANTVMLLEADQAVAWTEPNEMEIDLANPGAGLGALRSGSIYLAWASGMVGSVADDTRQADLKAMFTPDSGEPFGFASVNHPIDPGAVEVAAIEPESAVADPEERRPGGDASPPSASSEVTKLSGVYRRAASLALTRGDHGPAWRWFYGAAALGDVAPDLFEWYPALRRPAFGLHYGVALIEPERATRNGDREPTIVKTDARTRTEFLRRTAPFGEEILEAVERSAEGVALVRLAPPASAVGQAPRRGNRETPRVVTYFGGGTLAEMKRLAELEGCDVLVVLEKSVSTRGGKPRQQFRVSVTDLVRDESLLRAPRVTLEPGEELRDSKAYQELVWSWRDLLEDGLSPGEWPVTLRESIAAKRVTALGASNDPFPPRAISEIGYYRSRRLVDAQEVLLALRELLGEERAMALVLGDAGKRERVLRDWLPPQDPEQLVEEAARNQARVAAVDDD
ncbi:hypothetical protein Pla108_13200 [Botrimarina colliarenosi]|uniref:DUF1559 domain-containing protein n=1 Tax=Botrimarina colliarenosi TaxID=2528001 RepID=A0A5C6ALS8_9BACT|nr:DUF1559 domain-containing protein [Botrimarina colliarenosi]TWU00371.1 hypothetical protein Pla108_13200 [Botrimarina colliarenosi]